VLLFLHEHQLRFDILGGDDIDFSLKIFTIITLSFFCPSWSCPFSWMSEYTE
jgi:hypothetical protein